MTTPAMKMTKPLLALLCTLLLPLAALANPCEPRLPNG